MRELQWREPSPAERAVASDWIAAWNLATGDDASLPDDLQAADSCGCRTCPTFALRPVHLKSPNCHQRPLAVEGAAVAADGTAIAGLIAFWDDSELEIEIYPYAGAVVRLEEVSVTIDGPGSRSWTILTDD